MPLSRREIVGGLISALVCPWPARLFADNAPIAKSDNAFEPTPQSLAHYQAPAWFGEAKFGIWSHWDASSVPGIGNGYPSDLYKQGSASYAWHIAHFGHPSKVGFKDVIASWKAEHFDPAALMARYKAAGAKYFVALATHHDNFDNFDSTYNPWNSVKVGPKKDIVGLWNKAALQNGVRFGVSWHADQRGWDYYHLGDTADKTGPLAGVPYDIADPAYQSLYNPPHKPRTKPSADWLDRWTKRQIELIDKYRPDLLYYDGGISFPQDGGMKVVAHFLNANSSWHGGACEAVINTKDEQFVRDYERGEAVAIRESPWQCDTSLAGWFFLNDAVADPASRSKDAATVIHLLVDVVSKNGNLLLNVPQRGDGTLYPECETVLDELAKWMPINGEAIFGTQPWLRSGEGPSTLPAAKYMNELKQPLTWQDLRFTRRGNVVYAICLGVPQSPVCISSLGRLGPAVQLVQLLGSQEKLKWASTWEGLVIQPPTQWPCDKAVTFKVTLSTR
jgi:alpha-L-fucosidase